jgi:hypothetical protein
MIQRGQDLGFALEAGEALGVGGHGLRQNLDRHLAAELRVFGAIDLPHAAFTKLGGDLEVRERGADHGSVRPARGPAASILIGLVHFTECPNSTAIGRGQAPPLHCDFDAGEPLAGSRGRRKPRPHIGSRGRYLSW